MCSALSTSVASNWIAVVYLVLFLYFQNICCVLPFHRVDFQPGQESCLVDAGESTFLVMMPEYC